MKNIVLLLPWEVEVGVVEVELGEVDPGEVEPGEVDTGEVDPGEVELPGLVVTEGVVPEKRNLI